jgi:crossover junction endodeoxyribonuclease RuvC
MRVLGLDLSLTATGWAGEPPLGELALTGVLRPPGLVGVERLAWHRARLADLIGGMDLVVLEGYSFASKNSGKADPPAELGGVVRLCLYDQSIPFAVVTPQQRAMYATGRGNARKDEVIAAIVHRTGVLFRTNDEVDAWTLWAMGKDRLGEPPQDFPQTHRRALEKVAWPDVLEVADA